jgi:hypothetical protein
MAPDNSAHLIASAQLRTKQARRRARQAIRHLDRVGDDITIQAVSKAAGVSRSFLYRQPGLRAEIERLRRNRPVAAGRPLPSAMRATEESRRAQVEAIRVEIERLRQENRWLRQQAETLLGERRASPQPPHDGRS